MNTAKTTAALFLDQFRDWSQTTVRGIPFQSWKIAIDMAEVHKNNVCLSEPKFQFWEEVIQEIKRLPIHTPFGDLLYPTDPIALNQVWRRPHGDAMTPMDTLYRVERLDEFRAHMKRVSKVGYPSFDVRRDVLKQTWVYEGHLVNGGVSL